eukprot:Polyplicarium_translucidae@DN1660_c0_g1_i1.p1
MAAFSFEEGVLRGKGGTSPDEARTLAAGDDDCPVLQLKVAEVPWRPHRVPKFWPLSMGHVHRHRRAPQADWDTTCRLGHKKTPQKAVWVQFSSALGCSRSCSYSMTTCGLRALRLGARGGKIGAGGFLKCLVRSGLCPTRFAIEGATTSSSPCTLR